MVGHVCSVRDNSQLVTIKQLLLLDKSTWLPNKLSLSSKLFAAVVADGTVAPSQHTRSM